MKSPPYTKPVESKKPDTKSEHELNAEALYPPESDTDTHNLKVTTMLELIARNQELKERVRELEAINADLLKALNSLLGTKSILSQTDIAKAIKGE